MAFDLDKYRREKKNKLQSRLDSGEVIPPPQPWGNRSDMLHKLGFKSYQQYLKSELWAAIRSRVLMRDNHQCLACGRKATQVHHRTYQFFVLKGDDDSQLVSLCGKCHRGIEFHSSKKRRGQKRHGVSVDNALKRMTGEPVGRKARAKRRKGNA